MMTRRDQGQPAGIRSLSSFTPVEQRAILALVAAAESPYVAPPAMSDAVRERIAAERGTPKPDTA